AGWNSGATMAAMPIGSSSCNWWATARMPARWASASNWSRVAGERFGHSINCLLKSESASTTKSISSKPGGLTWQPRCSNCPAKPFSAPELWTLRRLASPQQATRSDGLDAAAALACPDGKMVGPVRLREPQLRGLAEPYSITMDFGPLPTQKPLALLLTGWLR